MSEFPNFTQFMQHARTIENILCFLCHMWIVTSMKCVSGASKRKAVTSKRRKRQKHSKKK